MRFSVSLGGFALSTAMVFLAPHAHAQDFPARPITLVVPYAAGGGNDTMARIAADRMAE